MRFKKIYVEITNICNLSCSFCSPDNRLKEEINLQNFTSIINKIRHYTDSIYLHVKGEPLLHSKLDEILTICDKNHIKVKITTNGTLLKRKYSTLQKHYCIKQINISLHSEQNQKNYFENVFNTCNKLANYFPIVYRIWLLDNLKLDKLSTMIVNKIKNYYQLDDDFIEKVIQEKNIKIQDNIYLDKDNEFTWPDNQNESNDEIGSCLGTRSHIAILVNGDIVPCCLDSKANLKLGNIFESDLEDILNSKLFREINSGFQNHKIKHNLCRNCQFRKQKFH